MLLHPGKTLSLETGQAVWAKKEGVLLNTEPCVKLSRAQREQLFGTLLCILAVPT